MADEKRIATFEWLNDNLYEFRKGSPLNSKKGVTKNELITNYNVDESLLTTHTDKRLVTRQNCVGITQSIDCSETISTTGTSGIYEVMFDLGTKEGTVFIDTISHNTPDRFIVYSPTNEVLADSLYYGETPLEIAAGTYTLPIKRYNPVSKVFTETGETEQIIVQDSDIDQTIGIGEKTISFFKRNTASSYIVKMRVFGIKLNTGWDVKIQCPSEIQLGAHALQGMFVDINPTTLKYELSSNDASNKTTYYTVSKDGVKVEIGKTFVGVFNESEVVFPPISYVTDLSVMYNGNKFFKNGDVLVYSNKNYGLINTFSNVEEILTSPDKKFVMTSSTSSKKFFNGVFTDISYKPRGFLFGNGRLLSTLSSKVNYPPTIYTNTTSTKLVSTDEILVLENTDNVVKVFKWRKDFSEVPSNIYDGFIDDVNKNSISLKTVFIPGHTSRGFSKEISLNMVGKKVVMDVATQSNVQGLINGVDNGTKIFVRFGTGDFINNYFEYETPSENILNASNKNEVWRRNINILSYIFQEAKDKRDSAGFSELQRFNFAFDVDPNKTVYVKGQPILSNITHFYIGIRSTSGLSNKNCTLWVKDVEVRSESTNIKQSEIDVRRSEVEMYNKNIYPHIIANQEGYRLLNSVISGTDFDELNEIGFSKKLLHETIIEGVTKAELKTKTSLIPHGAISTNIGIFNTSDLINKVSSQTNLKDSVINKQGANLMIFNQNDNNVVDRTIDGITKKTVGFYFNSKFINLSYDFPLGVTNKNCIDTDGENFYIGGEGIIKTNSLFEKQLFNYNGGKKIENLFCFENKSIIVIEEGGIVKRISPTGEILNTYFDETKTMGAFSISKNKDSLILCRYDEINRYYSTYHIISQDGSVQTILPNSSYDAGFIYMYENGNVIVHRTIFNNTSPPSGTIATIVNGNTIIKHINASEIPIIDGYGLLDNEVTTDLSNDSPIIYLNCVKYNSTSGEVESVKYVSIRINSSGDVSSIIDFGDKKPKVMKTVQGTNNILYLQDNQLKYNNNVNTQIKLNTFSDAIQIGNNFYIVDGSVESEYDVKAMYKPDGSKYSYLGLCKNTF